MAIWNLKGKKLLIIDDYQEMRVMLRTMLEPLAPEKVVMAKNGEEAIECLQETVFDLVFCDYNLGKGKDGQQVLEEARYRGLLGYSAIFIMVTAENTSEMVMGAIDCLPDDYISKPFTRTVVHSRLKKLFDKKENLRDISTAMAASNYKKAINYCNKLLEDKPVNRMELLKVKGELLTRLLDYEAAADLYENIIEVRDIPWAYMALGKVRFMQEKYIESLEIFEGLIKDNAINVQAYDWLAKTHEALGDLKKAQEILTTGVLKSPKSILRQRSLAEIARKNEDLKTAKNAYENVIKVGHNSFHKQADDYNSLAKTMIDSGQLDDAIDVIENLAKDFENDANADLVAAITGAMVYTAKGDKQAVENCLETALELSDTNLQGISTEVALELTELCLSTGKTEAANEITKQLIRNHHDDKALIEKAKNIYLEAGKEEIGGSLIQAASQEIVEINNEGAKLLREGKIDESVELFMKAARGMPNNLVVNTNAAYSIIMQIKKTGKVTKYISRVNKFLQRVNELDANNKKFYELMELLQRTIVEARVKSV